MCPVPRAKQGWGRPGPHFADSTSCCQLAFWGHTLPCSPVSRLIAMLLFPGLPVCIPPTPLVTLGPPEGEKLAWSPPWPASSSRD